MLLVNCSFCVVYACYVYGTCVCYMLLTAHHTYVVYVCYFLLTACSYLYTVHCLHGLYMLLIAYYVLSYLYIVTAHYLSLMFAVWHSLLITCGFLMFAICMLLTAYGSQ